MSNLPTKFYTARDLWNAYFGAPATALQMNSDFGVIAVKVRQGIPSI